MFLSLNDSLLASQSNLIESISDSDGAKQRAKNLFASPIAQEWGERFSPLIGLWAEW